MTRSYRITLVGSEEPNGGYVTVVIGGTTSLLTCNLSAATIAGVCTP